MHTIQVKCNNCGYQFIHGCNIYDCRNIDCPECKMVIKNITDAKDCIPILRDILNELKAINTRISTIELTMVKK